MKKKRKKEDEKKQNPVLQLQTCSRATTVHKSSQCDGNWGTPNAICNGFIKTHFPNSLYSLKTSNSWKKDPDSVTCDVKQGWTDEDLPQHAKYLVSRLKTKVKPNPMDQVNPMGKDSPRRLIVGLL